MILRTVDGGIDGEPAMQVERRALLLPASADVRPGDIVSDVKDRRGQVLGGPYRVLTVVRVAAGASGEHKMAGIEAIAEAAA